MKDEKSFQEIQNPPKKKRLSESTYKENLQSDNIFWINSVSNGLNLFCHNTNKHEIKAHQIKTLFNQSLPKWQKNRQANFNSQTKKILI